MNFFEHQDVARRNTTWLVILFIIAVIAIMIVTYIAVAILGLGLKAYAESETTTDVLSSISVFDWRMMLAVGSGVLIVVLGGSWMKIQELAGGGRVIAEQLGGRRIEPNTTDLNEKKILNVVEEMSIASGTPVPPVYIMDRETSINAFAAGYTPSDAVIGVTRGCVELLNRDELQGVMAHEFSHIYNGDMRLNIRLIGMVHGILLIGLLGHGLVRAAFYSSAGRSRSKDGRGGAALAVLGFALILIGGIGVFFGRMIKAAVSRQREFLADASAVQFTRNPEGIGGALKKIGGLVRHAFIDEPQAEQASHMFFGRAIDGSMELFGTAMATHPPIAERVKRIDPQFDGKFPKVSDSHLDHWRAKEEQARRVQPPVSHAERLAELRKNVQAARKQVEPGLPNMVHLAMAAAMIESFDPLLKRAAHEPYGARALIFALLLDEDDEVRESQLRALELNTDGPVFKLTGVLFERVRQAKRTCRLPLAELAFPSLRELSPTQYETFQGNIKQLVQADRRMNVFEWALQRVMMHHLGRAFGDGRRVRAAQNLQLTYLRTDVEILLSALAHIGARDETIARAAFEAGGQVLRGTVTLQLLPRADANLAELDRATENLSSLIPRDREKLLNACNAVIYADNEKTAREHELLRAIAASLDVPMPPVLDEED